MQRGDRLRQRSDFRRVLRLGERTDAPEFVLHHAERAGAGGPRVGFVVSRRVGGAVVRNRAKRLLREAVRPLIPRLKACDVVVAAKPSIATASLTTLQAALDGATARAGLIRSGTDRIGRTAVPTE